MRKGLWSPEEDQKLKDYITKYGHESWSAVPKKAGLERCGKSCRLRWINYLRPDVKRGPFSLVEEMIILDAEAVLGNRWSQIASKLPGRTDNDVKNFWNSCIKKKLRRLGIDPNTHRPFRLRNNSTAHVSEKRMKDRLNSPDSSNLSPHKVLFSEWLLPSSPPREKSEILDIPDFKCPDIQTSELQVPLVTEHHCPTSGSESNFILLPPDNNNGSDLWTLQDLWSDQQIESQRIVTGENTTSILLCKSAQPQTTDVDQTVSSEFATATTPTSPYTDDNDSILCYATSPANTTTDNDYMKYWIQYCGDTSSTSSNAPSVLHGALFDSVSF